jgi:hypothetical protein
MTAQTALKVVRRQELTTVGKKSVSIFGYRNDLIEEHLRRHLTQVSNKWCSVDCAARAMFGRSSPANREGIRKRIRSTFRELLNRGLFLVIEYDDTPGGRGKIKAMKLFETGIGIEAEYAAGQIERMSRRQQLSAELKEKALLAIGHTS